MISALCVTYKKDNKKKTKKISDCGPKPGAKEGFAAASLTDGSVKPLCSSFLTFKCFVQVAVEVNASSTWSQAALRLFLSKSN